MELTKETLQQWLDRHPAISQRAICIEAKLPPEAIHHLYNAKNRNLTQKMKEKLQPVLVKYGWE